MPCARLFLAHKVDRFNSKGRRFIKAQVSFVAFLKEFGYLIAASAYCHSIITNVCSARVSQEQFGTILVDACQNQRYPKWPNAGILRELLGHICQVLRNPFYINRLIVNQPVTLCEKACMVYLRARVRDIARCCDTNVIIDLKDLLCHV